MFPEQQDYLTEITQLLSDHKEAASETSPLIMEIVAAQMWRNVFGEDKADHLPFQSTKPHNKQSK